MTSGGVTLDDCIGRRGWGATMKATILTVLLVTLCGLGLAPTPAGAQPQPGDIYREYPWRPEGKWQRVTGPDTEEPRAIAFLPNTVNRTEINDLDSALRAEMQIEMLLCHGGTVGKKVRVNGHDWIDIPEPDRIPGNSGQGPPDSEYQYMRYPIVDLPLAQVEEGENTFEFTCCCGTSLGGWWPQWILYGVTFRVYYEPDKPHPTGRVVQPVAGAVLADRPKLVAEASGPAPLQRVDFVGHYEDFNWEGDGRYRQWHGRTWYGQLHNHIGTATGAPCRVTWDTTWVPTQSEPIRVAARIVDTTGICFVTPAVDELRLARRHTVRMYRPYEVPRGWSTRAGSRHFCKVNVADDLTRAVAAKIIMVTWNGVAADEIGINDTKVVARVGKDHDLSHDEFPVPVEYLRPGVNTLYTFSDTTHHGIEVNWPGMVLMIRYDVPEGRSTASPPLR
jgi:hypothetical protein